MRGVLEAVIEHLQIVRFVEEPPRQHSVLLRGRAAF